MKMKWHWKLKGIDRIENEGVAETTRQAYEEAMLTLVQAGGGIDLIENEDIKEIKIWREG